MDHKARINETCGDIRNYTPLHILLSTKDVPLDLVEYLLDQGADVNAISENNQTPLHLAVFWNHLGAVKLLVNRKANLRALNSNGRTPLDLAVFYGYEDIAQFLANKMGVPVPQKMENNTRKTVDMQQADQPPPPSN